MANGATVRFAPDPAGLLDRISDWARTDGAVHALLLLGSRARAEHPADEWSDTDLIIVVEDPVAFLADAAWPERFGSVAISFVEETPHGRSERRVLYADGTDLDAVPVGVEEARSGLRETGPLAMLARGYRILLDKDGITDGLPELISRAGEQSRAEDEWPPAPVPFENLVGDFWYHAVWSARKLRRGELWVALDCIDGHMKRLLLQIIEWEARIAADGGGDHWVKGRFLERWADPETLSALRDSFAHYDPADVGRALGATMDLFRRLANDLAVRLELPYPARADETATGLVAELLQPVVQAR